MSEVKSPPADLSDKSPEKSPPLDVAPGDEQLPSKPPLIQNKQEVVYAVGYRKPPQSGYFPKGVSGNPGGRPPGSKNKFSNQSFYESVREATELGVLVREGDRTVMITSQKAMLRTLLKL